MKRSSKGGRGNANAASLKTTHKTTGGRPFGRKGGRKRKGSRY